MTNEQIKQILNNAPDGATHIDAELDYWKVVSDDECILMSTVYAYTVGQQYPLRSLADLREILALREENESLKASIPKLQAQTIRDAADYLLKLGFTHAACTRFTATLTKSLKKAQK